MDSEAIDLLAIIYAVVSIIFMGALFYRIVHCTIVEYESYVWILVLLLILFIGIWSIDCMIPCAHKDKVKMK